MPSIETDPREELSEGRKLAIEALIDYITTTPQNINYNIVREIIKAIILGDPHPYFDYYLGKINSDGSPVLPPPLPGDDISQ